MNPWKVREELWKRVKHLEGESVGVYEARDKYGISVTSLYRWIRRGYVRVVRDNRGGGRGQKRLLNEADVAYASLLVERAGGERGHSVFSPKVVPPHFTHS